MATLDRTRLTGPLRISLTDFRSVCQEADLGSQTRGKVQVEFDEDFYRTDLAFLAFLSRCADLAIYALRDEE